MTPIKIQASLSIQAPKAAERMLLKVDNNFTAIFFCFTEFLTLNISFFNYHIVKIMTPYRFAFQLHPSH